jgi:hypothetical protein
MSLIGITNVESRKRRTPFIEQLNKLLLVKQFGDRVLDDETDTDAVRNRAERGLAWIRWLRQHHQRIRKQLGLNGQPSRRAEGFRNDPRL